MANKVIQVMFTEYEFEHLEKQAEKDGLTVSLYIKNKVLDDTEFKKCFKELLLRAERIKAGTKFDVKAVFGTDWNSISKGVRLALGKAFYNYVNAGKLKYISALPGKEKSDTQMYERS